MKCHLKNLKQSFKELRDKNNLFEFLRRKKRSQAVHFTSVIWNKNEMNSCTVVCQFNGISYRVVGSNF